METNIDENCNMSIERKKEEKKKQRFENSKVYSYNMKSYFKGEHIKLGNEFLNKYFNVNLIDINEDFKKYYFNKSILNYSQYLEGNLVSVEFIGAENIYNHFYSIKSFKKYQIIECIIQPSLGQAFNINIRGIINDSFKFVMNINTILLKKELHILNQYFNVE